MARCTTNEPRSALRESVAPRHSARGPTELRARNDRAPRAQGPLVRSAAREREHTSVHGDLHFLGRGERKLDVRQGDGELVALGASRLFCSRCKCITVAISVLQGVLFSPWRFSRIFLRSWQVVFGIIPVFDAGV